MKVGEVSIPYREGTHLIGSSLVVVKNVSSFHSL